MGEESSAWVGTPANDWPPWTGLLALLAAFVFAQVGALIVDIPALALGVKFNSKYTPPGLELGGTIAQDIAFVLTVVLFAQLGGRTARSWQIGYRPTPKWRALGLIFLLFVSFLILTFVWAAVFGEEKEKLLEQLGTKESHLLLILSALLTTVIAPIAEETLFRGYIFPALSKWKGWLLGALLTGVLFGAVHAGSAPLVDLVPLGALGVLLCVLYRRTGSLYPCIAAHSLNNSIAFGAAEKWGWQIVVLILAAWLTIALLALLFKLLGVISDVPPDEVVVLAS